MERNLHVPRKSPAFWTALETVTGGAVFWKRRGPIVRCEGGEANRHQVARGMAWVYVKYNADQSLVGLEHLARREGRGLWRDEPAIAPWEFRRTRKPGRLAPQARTE